MLRLASATAVSFFEPLECLHFGMFGPSLGSRHVAPYIAPMCGRVVQASDPLRYAFVDGLSVPDSRTKPPSYNVAPSQELYVLRQNHKTGKRTLDLLWWGLIPHGCKDPNGGRRPINAKAESVGRLPRSGWPMPRRCIVPVDGFFEWRAIRGARAKQPYAIAMKDGSPLAWQDYGRTGRTRTRESGNEPSPS